MAALIHYLDGPDIRRVEILPTGITLYGRPGHPTTLHPNEPLPADRCVIRQFQGQWYLKVLCTGQGTFVNNQRVLDERPLAHQDTIRCGGLRVRFSMIRTGSAVDDAPIPLIPEDKKSAQSGLLGDDAAEPAAPPNPYAQLSRQQLVNALVANEQALSALEADLRALRSSKDALVLERNQAHTKLHQCELQLRAETRVSGSLREDLQKERAALKEANNERIILRRNVEGLKGQMESAQKQAEMDVQRWTQERARLSLEVQEAHEIRRDNEALVKRLQDLEQIVSAQDGYRDALARRDEVEKELRQLVKDNESLRKELAKAQRESERLKDELAHLQGRF